MRDLVCVSRPKNSTARVARRHERRVRCPFGLWHLARRYAGDAAERLEGYSGGSARWVSVAEIVGVPKIRFCDNGGE